MAYKALYRTYRPNSFEEIAGQEHIVRTLQNAVNQNKIAHAYLFCGPRGTGKTSIAKIFAKAVNCTDEHNKPCMKCENCMSITEGSHPDIIEIDAASNNGVEEVRNLIEKVKYAPLKGHYKVYIIDEVHMMSAGAFNALLKTIEEPPAHVIFILATTEPHKVIPTIISRCQRYDFTRVPTENIINRIHTVLKEENLTCDEEVIRIISQLCDGGMRDALSILDQCIAYAGNHIEAKHINEIYGITTIFEKIALLDNIHRKKASEVIGKVTSLIEKGIDIRRLTVDIIDLLKESVIYDYTKSVDLIHLLNHTEVEQISSKSSTKQRLAMIDILMDTYEKYRNAANVGSYFEVCLLKMMNIEDNCEHVIQTNQISKPTTIAVETIPVQTKVVSSNVSRETLQTNTVPIVKENEFPPEPEYYDEPVYDEPVPIVPKVIKSIKKEEPIPEKFDNKAAHPLDDEFVLQLLVGANKPEKVSDLECFKNINEFQMDLQWAKAANLLKRCNIMASGTTYLIMCVANQAEANEINEKDRFGEFIDFTEILLHKAKKIYAITNEQQARIVRNFRERMDANTLPIPAVIRIDHIRKEPVKELSEEDLVLDLFGKENIIITED